MSDYSQTTDFSAKDALSSGDPEKIILGSDVDDELAAISTAIASKPDQGEIQGNTFTYFTASGTDTYAATPVPAISSYTAGQGFVIKFTNANTGAATLNLNTQGATSILKPGGAVLQSGDISAGMVAYLLYDGSTFILMSPLAAAATFPRNHISGLLISRDTDTDHDTNITAGEAANMDNDLKIVLGSEMTKRIDANWSAGDDNGGFPSGLSLSNDTWYHVFVILNPTTGAVDAGYDTSLTASNLLTDASGYTEYRRVGSVLTDGSANITAYIARENGGGTLVTELVAPVQELSTTTQTVQTVTITTPLGISVEALLSIFLTDTDTGSGYAVLSSGDRSSGLDAGTTNMFVAFGLTTTAYGASFGIVWTNTSSQVYADMNAVSGSPSMTVTCFGWIDPRIA